MIHIYKVCIIIYIYTHTQSEVVGYIAVLLVKKKPNNNNKNEQTVKPVPITLSVKPLSKPLCSHETRCALSQ